MTERQADAEALLTKLVEPGAFSDFIAAAAELQAKYRGHRADWRELVPLITRDDLATREQETTDHAAV